MKFSSGAECRPLPLHTNSLAALHAPLFPLFIHLLERRGSSRSRRDETWRWRRGEPFLGAETAPGSRSASGDGEALREAGRHAGGRVDGGDGGDAGDGGSPFFYLDIST